MTYCQVRFSYLLVDFAGANTSSCSGKSRRWTTGRIYSADISGQHQTPVSNLHASKYRYVFSYRTGTSLTLIITSFRPQTTYHCGPLNRCPPSPFHPFSTSSRRTVSAGPLSIDKQRCFPHPTPLRTRMALQPFSLLQNSDRFPKSLRGWDLQAACEVHQENSCEKRDHHQ